MYNKYVMYMEEIFKKYKPNYDKLLEYGFIYRDNKYIYSKNILEDTFKIEIVIDSSITVKIIDLEFNEEYINYKLENNNGTFSSKIKEIYEDLLLDIRDKCFYKRDFVSDQANRISNKLYELYNTIPSFEWDSTTDAVFRNNNKWYGLIMNIDINKITPGTGKVDVLNIKLEPNEIIELLNKKGFYKAYHMNKKYWISIILDNTIEDNTILELISESYSYTIK